MLIDALPSPVWARDPSGQLTWVNAAYARAVETRDSPDVVSRHLEILDRAAREVRVADESEEDRGIDPHLHAVLGHRRLLAQFPVDFLPPRPEAVGRRIAMPGLA